MKLNIREATEVNKSLMAYAAGQIFFVLLMAAYFKFEEYRIEKWREKK